MNLKTNGSAMRPEFFNNLPTFEKQVSPKLGVSDEERHYYGLTGHKGYLQLKMLAEDLMKDLDQVTSTAMAQGLTWEEIGRNAVVANLAKGIIKRLFDTVEDVKENVEKDGGNG